MISPETERQRNGEMGKGQGESQRGKEEERGEGERERVRERERAGEGERGRGREAEKQRHGVAERQSKNYLNRRSCSSFFRAVNVVVSDSRFRTGDKLLVALFAACLAAVDTHSERCHCIHTYCFLMGPLLCSTPTTIASAYAYASLPVLRVSTVADP